MGIEWALLASALALGLAGVPHCTAMCAAPCAAAAGAAGAADPRSPRLWAFHGARIAAYALAGAVAASSVGLLGRLAEASSALRPLWTLLHAGAFALGLWLLVQGRQPGWLERLGRGAPRGPAAGGWQAVSGPGRASAAAGVGRAAGAGALWVAWPCGLLQSALLLAAMANHAAGGALVMAGFATVSAAGLWAGPALWALLAPPRGGAAAIARAQTWGVRLAGLALAGASGWALTHGLWQRVWLWCTG